MKRRPSVLSLVITPIGAVLFTVFVIVNVSTDNVRGAIFDTILATLYWVLTAVNAEREYTYRKEN